MIQEQQAIVNFALENEENLELTFLAHQSYSLLCKELAVKFHNNLRECVVQTYSDANWILPETTPDRSIEFMMGNQKWPGNVKFGCRDFNDMDRLCFFVKADHDFRASVFSAINASIKGKTTGIGWWCRFKDPYNRWETSFDGVRSLYNSEDMVNYIMDKFMSLSKVLEEHFATNPVNR